MSSLILSTCRAFQGFLVGLMRFQLYLHFSLNPLQFVYLFIEFPLEILDCFCHIYQPYWYVFLGITQEFILIKFFLISLRGFFVSSLFKLLEYFGKSYDCSFKLCIQEFIYVILLDKLDWSIGVEGYYLELSLCCAFGWYLSTWTPFISFVSDMNRAIWCKEKCGPCWEWAWKW